MSSAADFASVMRDLIALVKAHEIEKARQLVNEAQREAWTASFIARQKTIHAINLALSDAQKQRESLSSTIDDWTEREKLFAHAQIKEICRTLIDPYISALRTEKRRLSKP